jgi:uncharacterized protein YbjT (DUF2867 family)
MAALAGEASAQKWEPLADKESHTITARKNSAMYIVFIAGATGYMGSRLAEELLRRGHKPRQSTTIPRDRSEESVAAALANKIQHFVYVSVAHPAPAMKAYIDVRKQCEEIIRKSGLNATILRSWYVLGPGHYWPYVLKPFYWLARQIPVSRAGAERLALVTLPEMVAALVAGVESPANGIRIVEVPEIAAHRK